MSLNGVCRQRTPAEPTALLQNDSELSVAIARSDTLSGEWPNLSRACPAPLAWRPMTRHHLLIQKVSRVNQTAANSQPCFRFPRKHRPGVASVHQHEHNFVGFVCEVWPLRGSCECD